MENGWILILCRQLRVSIGIIFYTMCSRRTCSCAVLFCALTFPAQSNVFYKFKCRLNFVIVYSPLPLPLAACSVYIYHPLWLGFSSGHFKSFPPLTLNLYPQVLDCPIQRMTTPYPHDFIYVFKVPPQPVTLQGKKVPDNSVSPYNSSPPVPVTSSSMFLAPFLV